MKTKDLLPEKMAVGPFFWEETDMIENWNDVHIVPEFSDQGVDCYRLAGGSFINEYYIVSEAETRKLMNHPEVVGYEVYASLVTATSQMMYYLKEQKKITSANILSILRGALNYPLEESCYKEHIRVHDISFMSSERVFGENDEMSLDIKYCKLTMVPNSTLMIGDIIASGETLVQCLRYVTDYYRKQGAKLRNILLFTIGGTQGIEILEKLTGEIRTYWPDFEGFITVYYEGVFSCYEEGDKGVSGINRALIDFYWKGGIVAPEFRRQTLSMQNPLFEKCTIYDGGARRYCLRDIARLTRAQRLSQDEGINLSGIARILVLEEENRQLRREVKRMQTGERFRRRP